MKKVILLIVFSILLIPSLVSAKDNLNSCELYKEGEVTILSSDIVSFKNKMDNIIKYLNKEDNSFNPIMYTYSLKELDRYNKESLVKEETVEVADTFESKTAARDYFNNLKKEEGFTYDNPVISKKISLVTTEGEEKEYTCTSFNCVSDILNIKNNLKDNEEFKEIKINNVVNTTKEEIKEEYKDNAGNIVYFTDKNKADDFANTYKPEKESYTFVKNNVIEEKETTYKDTTYDELEGNNYFTTYEDAKKALLSFQDKYNTTNGEVEGFRDESLESVKTYIEEFNIKEEAENFIEENTPSEGLGEVISSNIEDKVVTSDEKIINESYNTRNDADNRKNALESQGYNVSNLVVNENKDSVTIKDYGNILSEEKIEKGLNGSNTIENPDYIVIKQASGKYVVWTPNELTTDEENTFVSSITDSSLSGSTPYFISGYGSFNLQEVTGEGNWGSNYTFTKDNNNVILTYESGKISHITYGNFKTKEEVIITYNLTGKIYKENTVYTATIEIKDYVYAYRIKASIKEVVETFKYKIESLFERENVITVSTLIYRIDTTDEIELYKLSYDKYRIENNLYITLKWQINKCLKGIGSTSGPSDENTNINNTNNNTEITPPNTGTNSNNILFIILLVVSSGIVIKSFLKND